MSWPFLSMCVVSPFLALVRAHHVAYNDSLGQQVMAYGVVVAVGWILMFLGWFEPRGGVP